MRSPLAIRTSSLVCLLLVASGAIARTWSQADDTPVRDALSSGRATYTQFCAPCHGPNGRGDGAVASYLLKPPTDVTQLRRRYGGVFPQADLEAALLATSRDQPRGVLRNEGILWGPLFQSLGPDRARARVADLVTFLESVQER